MTKIAPSFNSAKLMFIVTGRMRSVRPHHPGVSLGKDSSAPSLAHVIASHRRDLLSPCMLSRGVWGSPGGQTDMQTWPSHWRNKAGPGVTALPLALARVTGVQLACLHRLYENKEELMPVRPAFLFQAITPGRDCLWDTFPMNKCPVRWCGNSVSLFHF